ncbi:hypothetical protein [Cytobacillus praedii]|uniref:hypothetical protein n=1 Tax=Cytobacillus praedii TaxID=1742358 RepID=UPI002E1E16DC|nr:hypothetical protein [Cytobacillus praedii]
MFFNLLARLAYDLEGLGAGASQAEKCRRLKEVKTAFTFISKVAVIKKEEGGLGACAY